MEEIPGGDTWGEEEMLDETWVQSLGLEDSLEEGMATRSSILDWRSPWSLMGYSPQGRKVQFGIGVSCANTWTVRKRPCAC